MEMINLLSQLVRINSVYPNEKAIGFFLASYLKKSGFLIQKITTSNGRQNIVATYGKSHTYLGFYGHMDTVCPDKYYKQDPFNVKVRGNKATGLGVVDMKGGITAILFLARFAVKNKMPVKIILGVDEENISQGAHDLVDSPLLRDISFLIVAESGQVKDRKQKYSVCYGRRGRVAIQVVVTGKTAHAAENEKGMNAIEKASILISHLHEISFESNDRFGKTLLVPQYIHANAGSFSVPDSCEFQLSAMTTPPVKSRDVINHIHALAQKLDITCLASQVIRKTPYAESYEVDLLNTFLRQVQKNIFKPSGIIPIYTTSVADENVFANRLHIPVITVGPIGGGDHTANEWVDLNSIKSVVTCYQEILKLFLLCHLPN